MFINFAREFHTVFAWYEEGFSLKLKVLCPNNKRIIKKSIFSQNDSWFNTLIINQTNFQKYFPSSTHICLSPLKDCIHSKLLLLHDVRLLIRTIFIKLSILFKYLRSIPLISISLGCSSCQICNAHFYCLILQTLYTIISSFM